MILYVIGNVIAPIISGVIFLVFASYLLTSRSFNSRAFHHCIKPWEIPPDAFPNG